MNYLLDTCVISDFFKKNPSVISRFEKLTPKQLHVSTITLMEIEYGLKLNPERQKKIRPLWTPLLQHIQVIPFSEFCSVSAAAARASLKDAGQPIGPFDILIAGSALAHNLILVTSNVKEFSRIPELTIEDWR